MVMPRLAMFPVVIAGLCSSVLAQEFLVGWGDRVCDSRLVDRPYVQVAGGGAHTLARRSDGSIVTWGASVGVPPLPAGLGYRLLAAGAGYGIALRSDGSLVGLGVAPPPPPAPGGTAFVELAAGSQSALARCSDGSVLAWGDNRAHQCDLPVLPPGLTLTGIAACGRHALAVVQSGSCDTFAPGCQGDGPIAHLRATSLPRLGSTVTVVVSPLSQSVAVLLAGLSNLAAATGPLPLDLSAYGMPGCHLRVRPDVAVLLSGSGNAATWSLAVPSVASLAGLRVHQQALVLDPLAGNAAGLLMSDAVTMLVGP